MVFSQADSVVSNDGYGLVDVRCTIVTKSTIAFTKRPEQHREQWPRGGPPAGGAAVTALRLLIVDHIQILLIFRIDITIGEKVVHHCAEESIAHLNDHWYDVNFEMFFDRYAPHRCQFPANDTYGRHSIVWQSVVPLLRLQNVLYGKV
uniref:Uncharacterized protein n=1 Tax=Romanomermis culicivorax TaxID=13658 RepID=A0A915IWV2_ROMCU